MHNLKPKKYLGQHFLRDEQIARRIVDLLPLGSENQVVEIGPGMGVLTGDLIDRYPRLKVVEVDSDAVAYLTKRFVDPKIDIIHADVLKWDMKADISPDTYFIGNLPYNISSPIFFRFLEHLPYIQHGVFMIQKEVAARICADSGNKTYGILSVLLGAYFELKYEFSVSPGSFSPPPKVVSGVLSMRRRETMPDVPFRDLKQVVKQAFNQRRKTLRNALKSLEFEPFEGQEVFFKQRAEQVDIEGFLMLTRHLKVK